jgi:hypothetical protein
MGSGDGGHEGGGLLLTPRQKGAIMSLAGLIGAATVIWQFGGHVADALPYATKDELRLVASDVIMLKKDNLRRAIITNQQLRYDNLKEQRRYQSAGEAPPIELLQDQENLQDEQKALKREMDQLEMQQ